MTKKERKVSKEQIEKMNEEQIKNIENKLGDKLRQMIDSTVEDANDLLSIYNMQVKMQFLIEPKQNS